MALDASLFNTQRYKILIRGKWSNLEKGVAIDNGAFGSPPTTVG